MLVNRRTCRRNDRRSSESKRHRSGQPCLLRCSSPAWIAEKRFSISYHLLGLRHGAPRVRLQCWAEDGQSVPSVVSVWPTCDWHEREQFDLMGIVFDGHPNLERLLMPEDWEGHPLRKDYPLGGEPVRFSDAV